MDWIRRVTHRIEEQSRKLNLQSWVTKARAAKWKWARQVACHEADRWTHRALFWDPEIHFDGLRRRAHGKPGRPNLRWLDQIVQFIQYHHETMRWEEIATNADVWDELAESFCQGCWRNGLNAFPDTPVDTNVENILL